MIDAEIRGKLGTGQVRAHERSEDLLTSTVFGLMRYVPGAIEGLLGRVRYMPDPFEGDSERARYVPGAIEGSGHVRDAVAKRWRVEFWPRAGRYGQPDVLLMGVDATGALVEYVLVEAKLFSGKGVRAEQVTDEHVDRDQLVRYWNWLVGLEPIGAPRVLVYLTSHTVAPRRDLDESARRSPGMKLAWLSWHDVWAVAREHAETSLPAADLARLLRHKGLALFAGFSAPQELAPSPATFWRDGRWFRRDTRAMVRLRPQPFWRKR